MKEYYCLFECKVDKQRLLNTFKAEAAKGTLIKEKGGIYSSVDPSIVMRQNPPEVIDLQYPLHANDIMLSQLVKPAGLHCNPKNNGLLIVPLSGSLNFRFYSHTPRVENGVTQFQPSEETPDVLETLVETVDGVAQPIAFNGRRIHSYWSTDSAVFYARKIPFGRSWDYVLKKL